MKTVFIALLLTVAVTRAQDAATVATQQATMAAQQAGQQAMQDMMTAGQTALLVQQQIDQFNQQTLLQMQIAGIDTHRYVLNIPAWNDWKVASWNHLDLSVKPGVVKTEFGRDLQVAKGFGTDLTILLFIDSAPECICNIFSELSIGNFHTEKGIIAHDFLSHLIYCRDTAF